MAIEDEMATEDDFLFLEAITDETVPNEANSGEVTQGFAGDRENTTESRDNLLSELNSDTNVEWSNAIDESRQTPDRPQKSDARPQAMFIFVVGEHGFSKSCELGILDEQPNALKAITSNPCLITSAFLKPALDAAMAQLRPSMMLPVAVRLTTISLRLVAGILTNRDSSA